MIIKKNDLNSLIDEMINEIKNRINPFETYTIVVPNLLLEQYIKTYWLRKSNSVLLNVQFKRLRSFLNEVFNNDKVLFTKENLSLLILKELLENRNDYPDFNKYITKNNELNNINLFDLANNLARIYILYDEEGFTPNNEEGKLLDAIKKKNPKYVFLSDVIKLNPKKVGKVFVFGFRKIQNHILNELERINATIYIQDSKIARTINDACSCSSKEREIEYIHGEICKILKNKDEKVYDICVYAPNLDEYETTIKKVFSNGGDNNYPEIPYVILNSSSILSNAALAINILYDVLYKEQFTRMDLIKLLTNSNIQKARKFDNSQIVPIVDAIDKMNVYRDNIMSDEWLYGLKRVLLSKLVGNAYNIENKVSISNEDYLPFGSISLDENTITLFASIIDDIREFRNKFGNKKMYNSEDLEALKIELNKWLFYSETEPNFYYNAALKALNNLIEKQIDTPFEIVFLSMINGAKSISVLPSNMISGGVTFINYEEDNIIASKYMFLLGMSNNNLPRKNIKDELDLRENIELASDIDRDVFIKLTNNASYICATYTNINLKSLEEFKPCEFINMEEKNIKKLGLLENRKYEELFTNREMEKKEYNIGLVSSQSSNNTQEEDKEVTNYFEMDYPTSVKHKDIASSINENLLFKIDRLFKSYDDFSSISNDEYEPLSLSRLIESSIKEDLLLKMIDYRTNSLSEETINSIIEKYKLMHAYPYCLKEEQIEELIENTVEYYNSLGTSLSLEQPFELELSTIIDSKEVNWVLSCNRKYVISKEDDDPFKLIFNYAKVKKLGKNDLESYVELYIIALAYIAKYKDNHEYTVVLGYSDKTTRDFIVSKLDAVKILNRLYLKMFDYNDVRYRSFDVLKKDTFDELIKSSSSNSWKYYEDKGIINLRESAGYDKNNYDSNSSLESSTLRKELIEFYYENVLFIKDKQE